MINTLGPKNFLAGGAISPYRFVKPGADDAHVVQAAAATDAIIGATGTLGADAAEDRVDVIFTGLAEIELGGTVTRGDKLTADASGQGVATSAASGANQRYGAIALASGVSGDIITVFITLGEYQGA